MTRRFALIFAFSMPVILGGCGKASDGPATPTSVHVAAAVQSPDPNDDGIVHYSPLVKKARYTACEYCFGSINDFVDEAGYAISLECVPGSVTLDNHGPAIVYLRTNDEPATTADEPLLPGASRSWGALSVSRLSLVTAAGEQTDVTITWTEDEAY